MRAARVLVGVDFSESSLAAARWVATHLAPRAEILLVHVLRGPEAPPFLRPWLEPMLDVVEEVAPALYGALRGLAATIGEARTTIDMRDGAPWEALAAAARDHDAELICVGRMRHRRGSARFGATTAQRLLGRTSLPVMVVPDAVAEAPTRILAAIDDRADARAIVAEGWRRAQSSGGRLDVLHVLSRELEAFGRASCGEAREELHRLTHAWLTAQLREVGVPPARSDAMVRVGDPGQEIVARANLARTDLIVMGRGCPDAGDGGDGGVRAIGSTTRLVLWAAPCPVLVVGAGRGTCDGSPFGHRSRRRTPFAVVSDGPGPGGRLPPAA